MMEPNKRALFEPLVLRDALASSGCLGYHTSGQHAVANENISQLPEAAVVCQARVFYLYCKYCYRVMNGPELLTGNMIELIICEMMLFLMGSLILHAVPFQPFLSTRSPLLAHTSLFISLLTCILVQFINLISLHTERSKTGYLGEGRGGARAHNHPTPQSNPPTPPITTVMHLY